MYKKIVKIIKRYNTIIIARHIGVDPDAMASQISLRDIIKNNFPQKNVYAIGAGSIKFNYIGQLDKKIECSGKVLLIVLDTPDKKRVDMKESINYDYAIKIDHHPFMESFCDVELIDETKSSTSEMIYDLVTSTGLKITKEIAEKLFLGIIADTERFMFDNSKPETFHVVGNLIEKYDLNIGELYTKVYMRPLNEVRFQGYMALNMKMTENGVAYIKITKDIIDSFGIDSASAGNMINNFNFIEEVLVWLSISEDIKNDIIRISMRSRGPIINKLAEKYNGGGHKVAAGARVKTFEEAFDLVKELDNLCLTYNLERGDNNED